MSTVATPSPSPPATVERSARRNLAAACVGNAIEWYDFAILGALAVVVGDAFFPESEPGTRLVAAFAIYGTAFLARPLGAVFFGRRGDRLGRRWSLVASVLLMTVATTSVGLLPGYATLGIVAPVLLVLLRAAQGFGAGGELGVAAAFIVEHAPSGRRGAYGAWHTVTLAVGTAAGFSVGALLTGLSDTLSDSWWRAGFLLALLLGLVALALRRRMQETDSFTAVEQDAVLDAAPLHTVWRDHRPALVTGFTLIAAGALAFNTFFVFLPNWLGATRDVALPAALGVAAAGLVLSGCAGLVWGRVSDRVGRRPVCVVTAALLAVLAVPLMLAVDRGGLLGFALAVAVVGALVGGVLTMATVAEMFPAAVRATGMSLTVGLASALVGGTAPLVGQLLASATSLVAPGVYVAVVAAAAGVALHRWPETAFAPLPDDRQRSGPG
ncbi:MFS transporter [Intrasporangium mesophilum]